MLIGPKFQTFLLKMEVWIVGKQEVFEVDFLATSVLLSSKWFSQIYRKQVVY